jgi:glucose uptake protein
MALLFALITVVSWGIWLIPAHGAAMKLQRVVVFHVTLANLVVSAAMEWLQPSGAALSSSAWLTIAAGGVVWTLSGACAFGATARLGPAKAMGIWSPLNILFSLAWGGMLFGEFSGLGASKLVATLLAVGALVAGLLAVIGSDRSTPGSEVPSASGAGLLMAVAAGVLWGSYFLPIRWSGTPSASAVLPMAVGMFVAAALILIGTRTSPALGKPSDYFRLPLSGALWSAGNLGSLALMEHAGTGRGFSIAQLCLVVNALVGIFFLRTPAPGSPAAYRVLIGCGLATLGGITLGLAR